MINSMLPRMSPIGCLVSSGGGTTSIDQKTAWALGVDRSEAARLIRVGVLPTVRRQSRLIVPAHALARLLPAPVEGRAR